MPRPRRELFLSLTGNLVERLDAVRADIAAEVRRGKEAYNRAEQGQALEDVRRRHGIGSALMDVLTKATVRELVLSENIRVDGRDTTTIRSISVEVGILPRTHGSGLFTRGQTQALSIATLGPSSDVQRLDTISPETEKRYMHHYNFPPYSVGESRPMRGPGRREIGHGALAERALMPVLPSVEEFPYVIRVVSEVRLVQRVDLHGQHLRQHPRPDGRGRADLGPGGRRGDGSHHRSGHATATRS